MKPPKRKVLYFCDETSHSGDEFMAVGGIAINLASIRTVEGKILDIRDKMKIMSEIKWGNVKVRRDNGHKAYADLLKELVDSNNVHFHIRFQRIQEWDHARAGPRKKIDTVSKAFYQLILHRPIGYYGNEADIHVRADKGECTENLHLYVEQLNNDARRKKSCSASCVKSIQVQDSKISHGLQLLDVTLGGLAAIRNGRHLKAEISDVKKELALHIHDIWGNPDLSKSSPMTNKKFNIWNARPLK